MDEHQVFICIDQKGKESKSLERQRRSNMAFAISTKFRKVVQENRVGVLQDVLLWLTTSHDESVQWEFHKIRCFGGEQHFMLIRFETHDLKIILHKGSIFLSWHRGVIISLKDIWIDDKSHILYICTAKFSQNG